ncbi:MAG: alpha-1,2-fucosyltransferase [Helicobacteraceae bacterium]|nr:alpha-1,2-fucosyltransferase [Helicobacteraceae bacterium]
MMIVRFNGGLGNQLHQYALYLSLKRRYPNATIKADVEDFTESHEYEYALESFFGLKLDIVSAEDKRFLTDPPGDSKILNFLYKNWKAYRYKIRKSKKKYIIDEYTAHTFNHNVYCINDDENYYFDGHWIHEKYKEGLEEKLRSDLILSPRLSPKDREIADNMENSTSIAVHIRRGDYISGKFNTLNICSLDYYKNAIKIMQEKIGKNKPRFFFFSDDIDYCKESFDYLPNAEFISRSDAPIVDFYMISKCKCAIIANSTFSHWAVWLTDRADKIVLYPRYHNMLHKCWCEMSVPKHWIALDNLTYSLTPQA